MKSAESFFNWAFRTRANSVLKLYNGEMVSPEKMFLSFCSHDPAFVSNGPAGLNASIKGIGFLPKDEYLEETLAAYIEHIKEEAARQAHVAELEQQRTSMMLELVNKEKDTMQQSYARDYAELTRLREQYNQLSTENAQHCEELRLIHASRGFKLLNMGYPIKKRIWKIFGKEI